MTLFKTKTQIVYEYLRDKILSAALEPGTRIMPSEVAEELGTSEIPVREALRMLESEGLVRITPHVGTQVLGLDPAAVEEIFLIRTVLEAFAARTVAYNCPETTLQTLEELLNEMRVAVEQNDYAAYGRLNTEFHRTLYSATPFPQLGRIIKDLWDRSERSRWVFRMVPDRLASSLQEHQELLDALKRGDGGHVERLLRFHKGKSFVQLLHQMADAEYSASERRNTLESIWRGIIHDGDNGNGTGS